MHCILALSDWRLAYEAGQHDRANRIYRFHSRGCGRKKARP